ncbi:hypothetical protein CBS14141_000611 [Malassezia furfur]|nr:hypothetical protein CBS14141_000611 [Malassezia furfur]
MDEAWTWAQARAPRHALESDDDDDEGIGANVTPRNVSVALHPAWAPDTGAAPPLVVLLGEVGAAALATHAPDTEQFYAVASTVEVDAMRRVRGGARECRRRGRGVGAAPRVATDGRVCAARRGAAGRAGAFERRCGAQLRAEHVHRRSAPPAADAPLRFLAQVPAGERAPEPWSVTPHEAYVPWGVPNTVTGVPAALFAEAVCRRVPALLLQAPDARHVPPPAGWTPQRLVVPYEVRHMDEGEAHTRLAHLAPALSPRWARDVCALLPPPAHGAAPSAQDTLHRVATQYLYAAQSHAHAGHVGDGGMYI